MTIDLDKLEALARDTAKGWFVPFDLALTRRDAAFVCALSPAVVLQWIAETRALRSHDQTAEDPLVDDSWTGQIATLNAKLRVAVEALESVKNSTAHNAYTPKDSLWGQLDMIDSIARTALATLSAPTGDKVK